MTPQTSPLWQELHQVLSGFVMKTVRDEELTKDIVQEVFLKVHMNIGTLRNTEKVGPWIFQIARHTITDHYRKRQRVVGSDYDATEDPERPATEVMETFAHCVRPMIETLPPVYREALLLSEIELPCTQAAWLVRCSATNTSM
ncbi:MAG: hypothetical protein OHK0039_11600 [Bacteroidia bacterium]